MRVYSVSIARPRPGADEEPYDTTESFLFDTEDRAREFHGKLRALVSGQEDVRVSGWIGSSEVITAETFEAALRAAAAVDR